MPLNKPSNSVLKIIWPSKSEMRAGLEKIDKYRSFWQTNPALLVIKPQLGLIVTLLSLEHDKRGFTTVCGVEQALVAPPGFDTGIPITVNCVWNQPYLSLSSECISAPYSFYLHFGVEGVRRARALSAAYIRRGGTDNKMLVGALRSCFSSSLPGRGPEALLGLEEEEE